jgi:DNA invertase Pin-like site-specific DNA recombinase
MGRGIFGLFAAMAQQESENISQRTKATKAI